MKSLFPMMRRRDWDGVQSLWVLPAARRLYLVGALVAIAVALVAVLVALAFHLLSLVGARTEAVPKETAVAVQPIDLNSLDQLFRGPENVRVETFQLNRPAQTGALVARVKADSKVGVAAFPEGVQVFGGRDAALLLEARDPDNPGGTVLVATERYAEILNALPPRSASSPTLEVRLVATDQNGSVSAPATLSFTPSFDAPPSAAPTEVEDIGGPESLRAVATILAGIGAQRGTPEWFDAFGYAMAEPGRCGTTVDDGAFVRDYDRSLRHVRAKLTRATLDTFYRGVCAAWEEQKEIARSAQAEAEAERIQIMARNVAAEAVNAVAKAGSRSARNTAIMLAAAATSFFMMVALFLAFLAIEGHSAAMREAVQLLAKKQES